jgi:drug/metabolite transporter (DMT)-like permease
MSALGASPPPAGASSTVGRGIAFMLGSVFVFSCANVLVKWCAESYPVGEIAFFRTGIALVPTMALVATNGGLPLLRTHHPLSHLFRGGIGVLSMLLIYYAFGALPIGDATAISFAGPLFMTALSVPMLGEKVGVYRWSAVIVGFLGVLLITRPGHALFNLGALAAVVSAFTYAVAMISVRQMSRTEHPVTIVFYFTMIGTLVMGALLPFGWVTPSWTGLAALVSIGLGGGIGQYFQTQAFRLAPAAVAGPFNYASIVFAGVFGYLIWDEVPTAPVLVGIAIVVASGLFIVYRETVRARETRAQEESSEAVDPERR